MTSHCDAVSVVVRLQIRMGLGVGGRRNARALSRLRGVRLGQNLLKRRRCGHRREVLL